MSVFVCLKSYHKVATMKKIQFAALLAAFLVYGCSNQESPVEPAETLSPASVSPLARGALLAESRRTASVDIMSVDSNLISVSKRITAAEGGKVVLAGSYLMPYLKNKVVEVTYYLSITFAPGDLPSDQTISIAINKSTFAENADVFFGPCGLNFNRPATLYLYATEVAIAKNFETVHLTYWHGGVWEPMPYSWGVYIGNKSGTVFATGKIPHFSRYAFGRLL